MILTARKISNTRGIKLNHDYHHIERNQIATVMSCSCNEPGVHTIIIKSDSIYGQLSL